MDSFWFSSCCRTFSRYRYMNYFYLGSLAKGFRVREICKLWIVRTYVKIDSTYRGGGDCFNEKLNWYRYQYPTYRYRII
jgi:hypothetical protein